MENSKLAPTSQYGGPYSRIEDYGLEVSITLRLTGCQVYWQSGAADCWMISFFEKVAVRAGSFKPKRFFISCINQDPVGFNVAVA